MTLPDPQDEEVTEEEWTKLGQSLPAQAVWVLKKVIRRTRRIATSGVDHTAQLNDLQQQINQLKNQGQNLRNTVQDHEARIAALETPIPPPT